MGSVISLALFVVLVFHWVMDAKSPGKSPFTKLWCWLKGSRKTYFFSGVGEDCIKDIRDTIAKFRTSTQRYDSWGYLQKSVIEISRGPFRRRSAIYGKAAKWWKVDRIHQIFPESPEVGVGLADTRGLSRDVALRVINTYPHLQAMLDRIAELERQNDQLKDRNNVLAQDLEMHKLHIEHLDRDLEVAKNLQEEWLSAVGALSLEIDTDRQRYRSPAAAHIRECLKVIIDWAEKHQKPFTPVIPADKVLAWKKRFPRRK